MRLGLCWWPVRRRRRVHAFVDRLKIVLQIGMVRSRKIEIFGMGRLITVAAPSEYSLTIKSKGSCQLAEQWIVGDVVRQPWP